MLQCFQKEREMFLWCSSTVGPSQACSYHEFILWPPLLPLNQHESNTRKENAKMQRKCREKNNCNMFSNLRLSPFSATINCSPSGSVDAYDLRWACSKADHISSSEYISKGSRLRRRVPEKRTGSWIINKHDVCSVMLTVTKRKFLILYCTNQWCNMKLNKTRRQPKSRNRKRKFD